MNGLQCRLEGRCSINLVSKSSKAPSDSRDSVRSPSASTESNASQSCHTMHPTYPGLYYFASICKLSSHRLEWEHLDSSAPLLPRSVPITESKHAEAAMRLSHMMHLAKFRSRLYQPCQTNSRGICMSCCVTFVTNVVFVCHGTISHEPSSCTRNTCAPEVASVPAVH